MRKLEFFAKQHRIPILIGQQLKKINEFLEILIIQSETIK